MSFLSPAWLTTALIGLGAIAIPVIIHYLFRSRYKVVPWAAMQFLRKSLEETTRRIQFRELLLLLLRIALLLLLAFALMRPSSKQRLGDATSPVDAVFILDVSGSMAVQERDQTRLEEAKQAALKALEALPSQSTIHILQTGVHTLDLGPASSTNRDQARFVIEHIEQGNEAGHLVKVLQQAAEILGRGSLANKEVYFFSDMQRSDWNRDSADLQATWSTLQQLGEVILINTRNQTQPANAALVNLRSQVALPLPGERVPFIVEVRNTGTTTLQGLTVTLRGSDAERDTDSLPVPPLKPGEMVPLTLTTRLEARGRNVVSAELQGDELNIDNRLDAIVETRDRLNVLIVDGQLHDADPAQSASFFLAHAIRSTRTTSSLETGQGIDLNIVSAREAYPAQLADVQACFLVGLGTGPGSSLAPEFADRLSSYVQAGGGLIIFAGGSAKDMGLQSHADRLLPALWGNPLSAPALSPLTFDLTSIPSGSFMSLFRFPPLDRLGQTETTAGRTMSQIKNDALITLRFSNKEPALVYRMEGTGCVMMVSIPADLRGSDAPLRPGYLPWIQSMLGHIVTQQAGRKNIQAGEVYSWSPPMEAAKQRFVLMPPGAVVPVSLGTPRVAASRPVLATSLTNKAGLYRILPEGLQTEETGQENGQADQFAVVGDPQETTSLACLATEELNERFSTAPVVLTTNAINSTGLDRSRVQHEWTPKLWWILLALGVGELAFGWYCNREV